MEDKLKPQDLRIGNLLLTPSGEIFKVRDISYDYIAFQKFKSGGLVKHYIEDLKPIKLSEDWLLKCGFVQSIALTNWWSSCENMNILKVEDGDDEGFWFAVHAGDGYYERVYKIEFVHQLQNQYYLLSGGSELTIKDNTKQ